jgi:hypothetical protein
MCKAVQRTVAAKQSLVVTYNISAAPGAQRGAVQRANAAKCNVLQCSEQRHFYTSLRPPGEPNLRCNVLA